jgi:hypothetical protein
MTRPPVALAPSLGFCAEGVVGRRGRGRGSGEARVEARDEADAGGHAGDDEQNPSAIGNEAVLLAEGADAVPPPDVHAVEGYFKVRSYFGQDVIDMGAAEEELPLC